ncbi:MAG: type II toxin-antitoxin system VapC family toxin [Pyrinomonadaceae bacterium]
MNYLIDTCVLSEYKKLKPESKVIDWLDGQSDDSLYISALTIGELEKGIVRMPASKRKTDLEVFLETLIVRFDRRLLSLDMPVMRCWGRLLADLETKGRIPPIIDSLVAATALEHSLTIVTRNEDDFAATGVKIINPWG